MEDRRERDARATQPLTPPETISRRDMVAGTVVTTVAAALPLSSSALAEVPAQDMMAFLVLSAALTGAEIPTLAPEFSRGTGDILSADPGIDPINIKGAYFRQLNTSATASSFGK